MRLFMKRFKRENPLTRVFSELAKDGEVRARKVEPILDAVIKSPYTRALTKAGEAAGRGERKPIYLKVKQGFYLI
jgi:hypothetical protein